MRKGKYCLTINDQRETDAAFPVARFPFPVSRRPLHKLFFIGLLLLLSSTVVRAQEEKEGGEIENVEIEIVKEKQITMPKANRNFEKVPPRPADPLAPAMTYDFKTLTFQAPDYNPVVKPLRLKDEPLSKIYGNYVSAGYGNYNSPFLRGSIASKRNAEKYYGVDFFHHSFGKGPVEGEYSGSGYSKLNGYLSGMGPKVTANVGLTYENMFNHFYGGIKPAFKPESADDIRQTYNIIGLNAGITNTKESDFNFSLKGDFSYLRDRFSATESDAGLHFNSRYDFDKTNAILFKADYSLIARKDALVEAKPRHLLKINPTYQFTILDGRFRMTAGLNAVVENDTIGKDKPIHIYPDVWIYSQLAKTVEAYAGITGDFEKVSLHTLARENQWINSNIDIFHTNKSFEFRAGIKGKVVRKVSFHVGTSVINYKHLYLYTNSFGSFEEPLIGTEKFNMIYDDALRLNFFGELGVVHADKVSVNLRGDYFTYSMKTLDYAYNRPQYKVGFYSSYRMFDKILLTVDLLSQGGAKTLGIQANTVVTLKSALNLNAKLRYFISKPLSVYVEANNALNNQYPIYQFYPARGVQVSAGLSWSF